MELKNSHDGDELVATLPSFGLRPAANCSYGLYAFSMAGVLRRFSISTRPGEPHISS